MRDEHREATDGSGMGSLRFSRSVEEVRSAVESLPELAGFDPVVWLEDERNICISDGGGNVALFERGSDGLYTGHYFFVVRGRAARTLARDMLRHLFTRTDIQAVRGMTPLAKLGARWMSRQLGFTSHGVIQTLAGPCELFILTKQDWKESQ